MGVALITGAANGIGAGIAEVFLEAGVDTIIADIDAVAAAATANRLAGRSARAVALQLDVTSSESWAQAVSFADRTFGHVDWLINNAGIAGTIQTDTETVTFEQWRRTLSVNLDGAFLGCRSFIPAMKARKSGHIVNTGSIGSIIAFPRCLDYGAAKFGVLALSRGLRAELEPFGIGVSALCPSFVATKLIENSIRLDPQLARGLDDELNAITSNLAGGITPQEVGRLVLAGIRDNVEHIFTNEAERAMLEAPGVRLSRDLDWLAGQ